MNSVLEAIFPMIANHIDNKKLREKLSEDENNSKQCGLLCGIDNAEAIKTDILKQQYIDTFQNKDKLEDKAKTNIIGITISITLIMGASSVLKTISEKYPTLGLQWFSFALLSIAVIYMLAAGIIAIKVLIDENIIYTINLNSFAADEMVLRTDYDRCIWQNRMQNLIRNNSVYTSYECIRNALICLFLILVLSTIPIKTQMVSVNDGSTANTGGAKQYHFVFSSPAVAYLRTNNVQSIVENAIIRAIENQKTVEKSDKTIGIIESNDGLFIKFSISEDTITILLIESFIVT